MLENTLVLQQRHLDPGEIKGKLEFIIAPSGRRYYKLPKNNSTFESGEEDKRETIIYARVSTSKQKDDLERQISYLRERIPEAKLIKDIGSGTNFKRKGLISLLEQAKRRTIKKIIVTSKDRSV